MFGWAPPILELLGVSVYVCFFVYLYIMYIRKLEIDSANVISSFFYIDFVGGHHLYMYRVPQKKVGLVN